MMKILFVEKNHNVALGRNIIINSTKWNHQKEEINVDVLKNEANTVLFTSPLEGVKYKIKNVKVPEFGLSEV
ncbi:RHS repeat-associated core domain-containing protein [Chryseobacterium sp. StRB126]|uniref:hypothetical protein n=1 Tax=Chryseobacterium sp. StRB126 TaxID=878220 RepID=UPI0004E986AB|nr:hypothetical protein [Chryseobacterium sp. StRB126]BAP30952.1 RHS repeat-associated core domain-containing protein [Chryseobacterium sp. StRB126]